ncbi:hypothetical protein CALVIDRAFT_71336 [Calocera viscosa TUFC12733]|uniref:Uncharacterized protein n=1 Tax=Calocera viscosa (strain TUFC12733) TaxID=1330018 RepID=A0A167NB08_CALVF|nr:hypothetical protein CALVIDRAFT_71336 [Calocera viscosa TUFC12733]
MQTDRTPLVTLFLEQGSIYFAIVCVALILETVLPFVVELNFGFPGLVLIPMASNRLFLSLRASQGGFAASASAPSQAISGILPTIRAVVDSTDSDDAEVISIPLTDMDQRVRRFDPIASSVGPKGNEFGQ